MGHEFQRIYLVETRRLLLVIGMIFAMALAIQYFSQPYGRVISSLFSVSSAQGPAIASYPTSNSLQNASKSGNLTDFDDFSPPEGTAVRKVSDGKESFRNNSILEKDKLEEDIDSVYESMLENFKELDDSSVEGKRKRNDSLETVRNDASEYSTSAGNVSRDNSSSFASIPERNESFDAIPPRSSLSPVSSPDIVDKKLRTPMISGNPHTSSVNTDSVGRVRNTEKNRPLKSDIAPSCNGSSVANVPALKKSSEKSIPKVLSISEMNDMLHHSRTSLHSLKPRWSSAVDQQLLNAKSQIMNAPVIRNDPDAPLYWNISMFKRSYELMEQNLKVYIYKEGKKPIFHQPVLKGIYASEGWFMKQLKANKKYATKKPKNAHLFYLPFSSRMLEETLYVPNSHSRKNLVQCLKDYLDTIVSRYPFWNRTDGADHFLVACHDWAPAETKHVMANCLRALCNSDVKEAFKFGRDVSLPETFVRYPQNPLRELGGKPPSQRQILAFFAGNMHGDLRPILLRHWENRDPDMKIFGRMPKKVKGQMNYLQHMKSSKFCICAKGYEVNSPRVVEAISYECVPVIISDNFVPPFLEVLNWESFAVFVPEKDIPNLKNILLSIPQERYIEMQRRVKQVQKHFLWNPRPVKYDIFHMILHSIWYNRVFQMGLS